MTRRQAVRKSACPKTWGYCLAAQESLEALRDHFRELLLVPDERGGQHLFRFYDPRVLRAFVTAAEPDEATSFFGPVQRFLVEGDSPKTLWTVEMRGYRVAYQIVPVSSTAGKGSQT